MTTRMAIGDFIARDGDNLSGIIKVTHLEPFPLGTSITVYNTRITDRDDITNINGNYVISDYKNNDRPLTLKDIEKIPNLIPLNGFDTKMKALLREAVLWCLTREPIDDL